MRAPLPIVRTTESASLLKRIQAFLHGQHIPALRKLEVEVSEDTAIIFGNVRTFYERQVGVECCKRVADIRKVIDLICVTNSQAQPFAAGVHCNP